MVDSNLVNYLVRRDLPISVLLESVRHRVQSLDQFRRIRLQCTFLQPAGQLLKQLANKLVVIFRCLYITKGFSQLCFMPIYMMRGTSYDRRDGNTHGPLELSVAMIFEESSPNQHIRDARSWDNILRISLSRAHGTQIAKPGMKRA